MGHYQPPYTSTPSILIKRSIMLRLILSRQMRCIRLDDG